MKYILALVLGVALVMGCRKADDESAKKARPEREAGQPSEKDQVESEVREGGLKDPGGAKSLRDESNQQQQEQQEQVNQVDQ
jgi:hypothetical protein